MTELQARTRYRFLATTILVFPILCAIVFVLHFHSWADLTHVRWQYTPWPPERVTAVLIAAGNRWPLFHDPHMLGYLSLPFLILSAAGLYFAGRDGRPGASALAFFVTLCGTIYLGGDFGMWTAFYRGLGNVDAKYAEGAAAALAGMTANGGAFMVTTTLAKLGFVGLFLQAVVLARSRIVPAWSVLSICVGSAVVVAFWDLDNWMLLGVLMIAAGLIPVSRRLRRMASGGA